MRKYCMYMYLTVCLLSRRVLLRLRRPSSSHSCIHRGRSAARALCPRPDLHCQRLFVLGLISLFFFLPFPPPSLGPEICAGGSCDAGLLT